MSHLISLFTAAEGNFLCVETVYSFKNLNKTTLSHSTQARHRCELARASTKRIGGVGEAEKRNIAYAVQRKKIV